jgi:hypothetical protein
MKATCSSETTVDFQRATRRYHPEDRTLRNHRCENLKSWHDVGLQVGFTFLAVVLGRYSEAKLKSNGNKASPCFTSFLIGKVSDKYLLTRTLLYVLFKHILISLTRFMGTQNHMRILNNISLLTELYNFWKSTNNWRTVSLYSHFLSSISLHTLIMFHITWVPCYYGMCFCNFFHVALYTFTTITATAPLEILNE